MKHYYKCERCQIVFEGTMDAMNHEQREGHDVAYLKPMDSSEAANKVPEHLAACSETNS